MKKKTYYHIILDQSGSMQDCLDTTISGFNEQLQVIQSLHSRFEDQEVLVGLTRFNHEVLHTYLAQDPGTVNGLSPELYRPHGTTALFDAIGTTALKLQDHTAEEVRMGVATVVVVILTDGYENASRLFSLSSIQHLINELEATGKWTFSYLGATLDAVHIATQMNIKAHNSMVFEKKTIKSTFNQLGSSLDTYMKEKAQGKAPQSFLKEKE